MTFTTNITLRSDGSLKEFGTCYNLTFLSTGVFIGYSTLEFYAAFNNSYEEIYIDSVLLRCIRTRRLVDTAYDLTLMILVIGVTLAMGASLEVNTIKEHLRRPKVPAVGLIAQFTLMPLIAYGAIWLMGYTGGKALGLFALGCCPGGGGSNMFSKLLNGDMSVSATLTTLSTVASIGMLPLWIYTLGMTIPADEGVDKIVIPFLGILRSLAFIIIPLSVGAFVKFKLPRLADVLKKWLNVMFVCAILFFFVFAVYVNLYIFKTWDTKFFLAAAMLPYGGFICGGMLAWICQFDWSLIKTIAIETGMQNVAVSILVVMSLSGQPDNDLAMMLPVASNIVAPFPLYIILPIYLVWQKILKRKKGKLGTIASDSLTSVQEIEKKLRLESAANENQKPEKSDEKAAVEMKLLP
ncbi:ileal sodium/bile acid cotransporter-like isoform X2 [Watersipora subatra]